MGDHSPDRLSIGKRGVLVGLWKAAVVHGGILVIYLVIQEACRLA